MTALRRGFVLLIGFGLLHFAPQATSAELVVVHADRPGCHNGSVEVWEGDNFAGCANSGDLAGGHAGSVSPGIATGGGGRPTIPNRGDVDLGKRDSNERTRCESAGNPIIFSTGNKIEPEEDFASGGPMSLSLKRTYNYYWDGIGIFGRRWLSNYDYKLHFTTDDPTSPCYTRPGNTRCDPLNKPIWAQRADGRKIKFNYSATPTPGWYEDKASPIAKIIQTGSTYTLYSESHTVEVYDYDGFPSNLTNEQGIGWAFTYDTSHYLTRVTHSSGRHVDFGWVNGLLATVTDPAGNVYHYTYATIAVGNALIAPPQTQSLSSSTGQSLPQAQLVMPTLDDPPPTPYNPPIQTMVALLTSTTQPGSPQTTIAYHYEDSRFATALTGKTINGTRYSWYAYDANARAVETKHANGTERYQFSYVLNSNQNISSVAVTNPLGKVTT